MAGKATPRLQCTPLIDQWDRMSTLTLHQPYATIDEFIFKIRRENIVAWDESLRFNVERFREDIQTVPQYFPHVTNFIRCIAPIRGKIVLLYGRGCPTSAGEELEIKCAPSCKVSCS